MLLLIEVENLITCSLANVYYLHESEDADILESDGMHHTRKELNIGLLKHEFLNIHKQFKAEYLADLNFFMMC